MLAKRFTSEVLSVRVVAPPLPQSSSRRGRLATPPLNWLAAEPVEGTLPVRMAALTSVEVAVWTPAPLELKVWVLLASTQFCERMVRASDTSEAGKTLLVFVE